MLGIFTVEFGFPLLACLALLFALLVIRLLLLSGNPMQLGSLFSRFFSNISFNDVLIGARGYRSRLSILSGCVSANVQFQSWSFSF